MLLFLLGLLVLGPPLRFVLILLARCLALPAVDLLQLLLLLLFLSDWETLSYLLYYCFAVAYCDVSVPD